MKKIIIANWKMNLNLADSLKLAREYKRLIVKTENKIVVCPSFLALAGTAEILKKSFFKLGAQTVFWQEPGKWTGKISAKSLVDIGCEYVIIGHSETRKLGETCKQVNLEINACLKTKKLVPIVCVGESLAQRKAKKGTAFITGQLRRALAGVKSKQEIIIAYEPIWAIGSGISPTADEISGELARLKVSAIKLLGNGSKVKTIYGGSVDVKKSADFLTKKEIDGLLVGGESLKAKSFAKIVS